MMRVVEPSIPAYDPEAHFVGCGLYRLPHRPRCTCDPVKLAAAREKAHLEHIAQELRRASIVGEAK